MGDSATPRRSRGPAGQVRLAHSLVETLGGRYSAELGIDVDAGDAEIERWFLASTLFGTRISAGVAERTFGVLDRAGVHRVALARHMSWDDLVALLDEGGYVRYDYRTATRLQELAEVVEDRYSGQVAVIGRTFPHYSDLHQALAALPGWGPVTIRLFLRELRGVWPGAQPPLDSRAVSAARHLGLVPHSGQPDSGQPDSGQPDLDALAHLASQTSLDLRDLESGLVRLTLTRRHDMASCPGGADCTLLSTAPVGARG